MGSSSSNQISESNKDKSLVKRNPMNKPESFYCFTDGEVEIIQSLLTEKKYELNDYISYMAYVDIDEKNITNNDEKKEEEEVNINSLNEEKQEEEIEDNKEIINNKENEVNETEEKKEENKDIKDEIKDIIIENNENNK